jgi:hypothetical protein
VTRKTPGVRARARIQRLGAKTARRLDPTGEIRRQPSRRLTTPEKRGRSLGAFGSGEGSVARPLPSARSEK